MSAIHYTPTTIAAVTAAIDGDEDALAWLEKNKFPEWSLFVRCMCDDDEDAFAQLLNGPHKYFAAFIDAIHHDGPAVNYLLSQDLAVLAAVANAALSDEEAYQWLVDHELPHYAKLADALRALLRPPRTHTRMWI